MNRTEQNQERPKANLHVQSLDIDAQRNPVGISFTQESEIQGRRTSFTTVFKSNR